MKTWTEADFEAMSWHDNSIHAITFHHELNGPGRMSLDIDHILEWLCPSGGTYNFRTVPATLMFREVLDLHIDVNFAKVTGATSPISIDRIRREFVPRQGFPPDQWWYIDLAWPNGAISFTSSGYVQTQTGIELHTNNLMLSAEDRQEAMKSLNQAL
jgi:hypothetical protein